MVALAKSKPGELTFASTGIGTPGHLNGELFCRLAGIQATHVPYRVVGQGVTDLIAGRISFWISPIPTLLPNIRQGQVRPLAIAGEQRSSDLPGIPTVKETGIGDFDSSTTYAIFGPAGTPPNVVAWFDEQIRRALDDPNVQNKLHAAGVQPAFGAPDADHAHAPTAYTAMGGRHHQRAHSDQLGVGVSYVIAIDIGGTFTDLVACDIESGAVAYTKSPTTYDKLGDAIFDCIRKAALNPSQASFIKHGTTLVINALLQRAGAKTALITTKGFRDVLEIGRGNRTQPFNLRFHREPPLIPRELRLEITERIDGTGQVRVALAKHELRDLAQTLRSSNVEALAISFLNSYLTPDHEQEAARELRRLLPDVFVTAGTELSREWHEFERTATAAANAYVGPQVSRYIAEFDSGLRDGGFNGSLLLMGSHGGVISAERGGREPITLVESGPVGGCIGAASYGETLGVENLVAFDMGGTTAKCAMIERGRYAVESIYHVGGPDAGFPIRGNVIDILEVGVGGGSIAWLDRMNRLTVGPRSAGSMPGPACYGRAGTEATVTDANLLLGRLDPDDFLGGEMRLDPAAARKTLLQRIGEPLGYAGEEAAVLPPKAC